MLRERSNGEMLTPAGRALAEGQTAAVAAELAIPDTLGHDPEFTTVKKEDGTQW